MLVLKYSLLYVFCVFVRSAKVGCTLNITLLLLTLENVVVFVAFVQLGHIV